MVICRHKYLDQLADQARKHGCAIHAWCLMTNHVHLLLTPEKATSAGMLMKGLGQRYVQQQRGQIYFLAPELR